MELALVTPVLFAICGFIIVASLAIFARYQMLEMTHFAVTHCSSMPASSPSAVASCVGSQSQTLLQSFQPVCSPSAPAPELRPLTSLTTGSGLQIWAVTQRMSCSYRFAVPLLQLVNAAQPAFTVAASSTAPFLPARN